MIEQTSFGDNPVFYGFVGTKLVPIKQPTSTFSSIKKIVEERFQQEHELQWSYDDDGL